VGYTRVGVVRRGRWPCWMRSMSTRNAKTIRTARGSQIRAEYFHGFRAPPARRRFIECGTHASSSPVSKRREGNDLPPLDTGR